MLIFVSINRAMSLDISKIQVLYKFLKVIPQHFSRQI